MLADGTIAVCGPDALWLKGPAHLPETRVWLIPNGVPLRDSNPNCRDEGPKVLGFIGRLVPEKAPERVLELLAELSAREDWRGVICGDGPLRPALEAEARARDLSERILWTGQIASADSILAAVDLLCLPSVSEGLPYVLLEALAAGVPILAAPVGGIEEVLAGPVLSAGCAPWDPAEWARRARNLTDPARRDAWSTAARQRAVIYSETAMVDAIATVYRAGLPRRTAC